MKVLVTGANGQLGFDVKKVLDSQFIQNIGTTRESLDIRNEKQVSNILKQYKPDVVIHCAAFTSVDKAEDEKDLSYQVNVLGTRYLAKACSEVNAKMVYISTDYVFNGEGVEPFKVTDKPNPINYYGKTKYEGELEVQKILEKYFIVRISWVFGNNGNNFVKKILELGKIKSEIYVVNDQIGSPTYTVDVSKLIVEMIRTEKYGIYHATNEGYCSWYEFACEIFKQTGLKVKVKPVKTEDYLTKAKRPYNSRLSNENLINNGFKLLPSWRTSLSEYLIELRNK
jgi:dTDP-4-dehydrorhamnose reductase